MSSTVLSSPRLAIPTASPSEPWPASPKVAADDTTLPVLDPGRGRTKTGRLWCYAVDNRAWSGPGHPAAACAYSEDRKAEHPAIHLKGFRGLLQVDGYTGFGGLVTGVADEGTTLAFYWAHTRWKFYDVHVATKSPLAYEALQQIGALYAIEADPRTSSGATTASPPATQPPIGRGHARLADRTAWQVVRPVELGAGDPLRSQSLGWIDPLSGRWPPRTGHQHRRARHAPGRIGSQERAFCRSR